MKILEHNTLKRKILANDFADALNEITPLDFLEIQPLLMDLAWECEDEKVLSFVLFLIQREPDVKKKSYLYNLSSEILTIVLPHLPNSFKKGVAYLRKAIKLNPDNLEFKKYFIETYQHPDAKEHISKKEIQKIVKEVLEKDPYNKNAQEVLKSILQEEKYGK